MTPVVTNHALAARLDAIADDVSEIKELQKIANGRISTLELAREREAGARDAVHAAAVVARDQIHIEAEAAKAIVDRKNLSSTQKIGVAGLVFTAVGIAPSVFHALAHVAFN